MAGDRVEIGKLRVRGARAGEATIRRGLARRLASAELLPAEIPPAAVLLVRRLADPRPGSLAPGQAAGRAWERAVQAALADQYRQAARPVRGWIAGEQPAILFADEAEMVACLALALSRGQGLHGWWWSPVLRALHSPPDPAAIWQARPALLPPALAHLASWGEAGRVVARLAPETALSLVRALARAFELPALAGFPAETVPHPAPGDPAVASPRGAPWTGLLARGAVPAGLGRAQAALLGTALALQARPAAVRAAGFRPALQRWWRAAASTARLEPAGEAPAGAATGAGPAGKRSSRADRLEGARRQAVVPPWESTPEEGEAERQPGRQTGRAPDAGEGMRPGLPAEAEGGSAERSDGARPAAGHPAAGTDVITAGAQKQVREDSGDGPAQVPPAGAASGDGRELDSGQAGLVRPASAPAGGHEAETGPATPAPERSVFEGAGAATAAGGIFYLLNVMRVLDVPGCFEQGWGLASQVGAWGVLELLGRGLLGAAGRDVGGDPLWRVLAALAGRQPGSLPGAGFRQQGPGGLPAGWEAPAMAWPLLPGPLLAGASPELLAWLGLALPPIAARLQRALELEVVAELPQKLLLVPGRIYATRSHVDLVMGLEAIRMPVRRAGLDANPGWLPHFGRVVTFYFQ